MKEFILANQGQGLQNLKRIRDLQKEGEISKILQELRMSKSKVEELSVSLSKRHKEIEAELLKKQTAEAVQEIEVKVETQKPDVVVVESVFAGQKPQERNNNFRKFDNKDSKGFRNNDQRNSGNNRFDSRNGQNPRQQNGQGNFGRDNKWNGNRNDAPQKKFGSNNFVSSKANNFRSFASADVPEIDVKNDRNFANKAKYAQKHNNFDEKKSQSKRREEQKRNNVFIEETAVAIGPLEAKGKMISYADIIYKDQYFNEKSYEAAERKMQKDTIERLKSKKYLTSSWGTPCFFIFSDNLFGTISFSIIYLRIYFQ